MTAVAPDIDLDIDYDADVPCGAPACGAKAEWIAVLRPCPHQALVCEEHRRLAEIALAEWRRSHEAVLCAICDTEVKRLDWRRL